MIYILNFRNRKGKTRTLCVGFSFYIEILIRVYEQTPINH